MTDYDKLYDRYARTVAMPAIERAANRGAAVGTVGGGALGGGARYLLTRRRKDESEKDFKSRRAGNAFKGTVQGGAVGFIGGANLGHASALKRHGAVIDKHMADISSAGSRGAANAIRRAPEEVRKRVGDLFRMARDKSSPHEAAMAGTQLTQLAKKHGLNLRSLMKTSSMHMALLDR